MSDLTRYAGGAAAVKDALRASHDLKPTERLVLVAIVAHANAEGEAWPSVATVADYVGCSERTVQRALRRLVEVGRLVVAKVAGVVTRVYRLVVGGGDTTTGGGDISPRGGDISTGGGDALRVTQRSLEDHSEDVKPRAARSDWRRFIPKTKTANPPQPRPSYGYPERRGAALPPPRDAERCPRHLGQTAAHCAPCRSEALGGAA
ncbi:helix-turn-helix domain-containing protein [Micromonospora noduli]|uniref:helix-turn-helix domain-containing protein n=1 Tax=Micromonospora noduli TaxID=709876 RepID=UPI00124B7399|nr:helix-turn-helix domain-containing protein [Micromonospora noduli]KAB1919088.1 helix-turn-helix domain-containing protein [Micromonospora noduli]